MELTEPDATAAVPASGTRRGVRIDVSGLCRRAGRGAEGDTVLLQDVSFRLESGELVAIVGPSGAGKTTLLETIAGLAEPTAGTVRFDGVDVHANAGRVRNALGYVPQDDIIHTELPLEQTLRYAARLRLPSSTSAADVDAAVGDALDAVGLTNSRDVRVGALSGGQRKRASIAVELVTDPHVFFLDEPTSGLDPLTSAELIGRLRQLADRTATVVFTTHASDDLQYCDQIVFLGRSGRLAYVGCLDDAFEHFGVRSVTDLYARLADIDAQSAAELARPEPTTSGSPAGAPTADKLAAPPVANWLTQWAVLTRRTFEQLVHNRLTLAILLGSPALIVAMFAVLFRSGAFDVDDPSPSSMVMISFWVVFGAFFFGLTYGLLQVVTERTILRRELFVGMRPSAYVASKVTILAPFLVLVVAATLVVLRAFDRLPARSVATYVSIGLSLLLCALAALALGLLTSALVRTPSQATLALPMLCFPAVLFSGAILPVNLMATVGAGFSAVIPSRWAFEALGHDLGAREILAEGASPLGPPLLESYGDAGNRATGYYWAVLAVFVLVFLAATWVVVARSTRRSER